MRVGIVSFPGSTGVEDAEFAFGRLLGQETSILPHTTELVKDIDLLVLPGGFSFGDHLRPGALARFTSIAGPIRRFARTGKILGLGNGFQVLCELGILGGAFLPNPTARFCSDEVFLRFEGGKSFIADKIEKGSVLKLPLACYNGMYFANGRIRRDNDEQDLVVCRYSADDGSVTEEFYANSSIDGVAALTNPSGNVVGIMAHPERAVEELFGNTDGLKFLRATVS